VQFTAADYDAVCTLMRDQCSSRGWKYLSAAMDDEGWFRWRVQSAAGDTASVRPEGPKRKDVYWMCEELAEQFALLDREEEAI